MSWKLHFWYWIFPTSLLTLLLACFFSGIPQLVDIINPKLNREWGLLENIQILIIAVIIGMSIYAISKKTNSIQKCFFGLVALFSIFVLLEETDYGMHIAQYFTGSGQSLLDKLIGIRNFHIGVAKISKRLVYVLMLIMFVVAPLMKVDFRNNVISYLIPKPKIIIIAALTIIVELVARLLAHLKKVNLEELTMDIGEFSEIMIYYIFLIYLAQLIFEKEWTTARRENMVQM